MSKRSDRRDPALLQPCAAAGCAVPEPARGLTLPRAVAFVWGGEALPTPSLPFGRWKAGALFPA